jgi:hypothetical protein
MASLFALLQKNVLDRQSWATRDEIGLEIERTYRRRRRQARPGRLTPIDYQTTMTSRTATSTATTNKISRISAMRCSARVATIVLVSISLATLSVACSGSGGGGSFTYEANFASGASASAHITYQLADGSTKSEEARLPWRSPSQHRKKGVSYRIAVVAQPRSDSSLTCGVSTSSGYELGNSSPSGSCTYVYSAK